MLRPGSLAILLFVVLLGVAAGAPGTAQATVLCEVKEEECADEDWYQAPTQFKGEATNLSLEGILGEKCGSSSMSGETTQETEAEKELELESEGPLIGTVAGAAFSSCSSCTTVQAVNLPYKSVLAYQSAGSGTLTIESSGKGNPGLKLSGCPFGITCRFGAAKIAFKMAGGEPATVAAEGVAVTNEEGPSLLCGTTATLSATYKLSEPKPVFVSKGRRRTRLCEAEPSVVGGILTCPAGKLYKGAVTGKENEATEFQAIEGPVTPVECAKVSFKGSYEKNGVGKVEEMKFENEEEEDCSASVEKGSAVSASVEFLTLPTTTSTFSRTKTNTAPEAHFALANGQQWGLMRVQVTIAIPKGLTCRYWIPSSESRVYNGTGTGKTRLFEERTLTLESEAPALGICATKLFQITGMDLTRSGGGTVYATSK